ncbi:MAG: TlpA family protein disulfide reductase [Bacteroidota bacterium]|nr:TlpA family protein disulfide reductase [Bacteroidota bacterium]MDX5428717.1 TlpA family protein disulfide reductase [Bacteroidota bacterium]MDX5448856.1 TlpA family protein disulfide reductase [Bacteroidota bacterium]MDX5506445.1 TlpA family protein disulfide reductase [Bacteroidota bacterium]
MKNSIFAFLMLFGSMGLLAQVKEIPEVKIKDIEGNIVSTSSIKPEGKPMVISFWATWCKPCIRELSTIHDLYPDWQDETGVKLVAISIDDARNAKKVAPFIYGQGWEYEIYIDENSDLRRSMGVNNIPHTFLIDKDGKVVWQHAGYQQGDEEVLYSLIQKLARGEKIESH